MSPYKLLSTSLKRAFYALLIASALLPALASMASAQRIGVGISTGRIVLREAVKPGLTYDLPKIAVFNNGDVRSEYEMTVQFNEKQSQYKPASSWIKFSPQHFTLEPGKAKTVTMTIRPATSARPGSYFAYLEAHPLKKDKSGKTAINIAAATKLSFKVASANIFQKFYYWILDLWNKHKQVIVAVFALLAAATAITLSRRKIRIEVRRKPMLRADKQAAEAKKAAKRARRHQ